MAYEWRPEIVVQISANKSKIKNGAVLTGNYVKKLVCRSCSGVGCASCKHMGYFEKKETQSVQISDRDKVQNGSWFCFKNLGDERPDLHGFGDVVLQVHFEDCSEPNSFDATIGSTGDTFFSGYSIAGSDMESIFNAFFGSVPGSSLPPAIEKKLVITRNESKSGCLKEFEQNVVVLCSSCDGTGHNSENRSICKICNGSGLVLKKETIEVQIPPLTARNKRIVVEGKGNTAKINETFLRGNIVVTIKHALFGS